MGYPGNSFDSESSRYIPAIDGLRAIAVISVILFHLRSSLLPGGFSGVDVFFVISGYVVSASLAKKRLDNFWSFAASFYSHRILRIYPALVFCLIVSAVLQTLFVPNSWLSTTSLKTGLSAFFGLSNFALVWYSDGYFSPRVEFNVFTHTWSLGVEEQFYLLFPVIFFWALRGQFHRSSVRIISNYSLLVLLLVSFFVGIYQTYFLADQAYYLLPSRFWELGCGALLFFFNSKGKLSIKSFLLVDALALVGLLLIAIGFVYSDSRYFPFPWALLPVIGSLLVITRVVSDFRRASIITRFLSNNTIVYLGRISYSLYLWHWPIIVLLKWTVGMDQVEMLFLALFLTLMMSVFSYNFVEMPIRKSNFLKLKPDWSILAGGGVVIIFSACIAGGIFWGQPYISLSVTRDRYNWYPEISKDYVSKNNSKFFGEVSRSHNIFVLGDSHADGYGTMFSMLKNEAGIPLQVFAKGGCSVANLIRRIDGECVQFIDDATRKIIAQARSGDVVFLAALRMNRFSDQWATFSPEDVDRVQYGPNAEKDRAAALIEADSIIGKFERAGLVVVIDAPKPVFKLPPFRCSDWFNVSNPVCKAGPLVSRAELIAHRAPVLNSINQLKNEHSGLIVWDPFEILCSNEKCSPMDGRLPLFFDGDHLSAHGNRVIYPSFLSMLKSIPGFMV